MFKKIIYQVDLQDVDLMEVLSKGGVSFLFKSVGAILAFFLNYLIAKQYGAAGTGYFFIMFSVLSVGATLSRLGMDNILIRRISRAVELKNKSTLLHYFALGLKIILISGFLISLFLLVLSKPIAEHIFNNKKYFTSIIVASLSIIPFSLIAFLTEVLKGSRNILYASFLKGFGVYLFGCLFLIFLGGSLNLEDEYSHLWIFLIAAFITTIIGFFLWKKDFNKFDGLLESEDSLTMYGLTKEARPLFISSIILILSEHTTVLMLGGSDSGNEVGVFGTCLRIGLLIVFCLDALNSILAPKFAQLFVQGNIKQVERIGKKAVGLITALTFPLFLLLFVFSEEILALFGSEFTTGSLPLKVIICGQFINLVTGPVGYVLIMGGFEKIHRNINLLSYLILLISSIVLIPLYTILGAAIAYCLYVVMKNALFLVYTHKKVGITTIPLLKV